MMRFFFVFLSFFSCASFQPHNRPALIDQILRPRPGFEGRLTNQMCETYKGEDCVGRTVIEYDLRLQEVRDRLLAARFICKVGKDRFRPCHEIQGLCHQTEVTTGFWPFRKTETKLIEALEIEKDYQRLLDANTVCAAQESDVGRLLFP